MSHARSPVLTLQNAIAGAVYRIAPERETELVADASGQGACLVLEDGKDFTFHVFLGTKEVTTTVATLEYLWCSAHAQLVLYNEYAKVQRRLESQFDARGNRAEPRSARSPELVDLQPTDFWYRSLAQERPKA